MKEITVKELIEVLSKEPEDTKIIIEDSDGNASFMLCETDISPSWLRDAGDSKERVILFSTYKEGE